MTITTLQEIWDVLANELPRDDWIDLQTIYKIIEANIQFKDDDFLPSAPKSQEPKWMRNVRNVLQHRKTNGDIAWDKNGSYMIPTIEITVTNDGISTPTKLQYRISEEGFKRIRESREAIGLAGENWVAEYEKVFLSNNMRPDLANKVTRISETNVGAGYDILSFETNENQKYIEVKTTVLSKAEFFISSNELDIAKKLNGNYWIYFVSEIYGNPQLTLIKDPINQMGSKLKLTPVSFQVEILG
jgi:hypothetical protein